MSESQQPPADDSPPPCSPYCPRRPYGGRTNAGARVLPRTVPIIGLGCSSFSTFFEPEPVSESESESLVVVEAVEAATDGNTSGDESHHRPSDPDTGGSSDNTASTDEAPKPPAAAAEQSPPSAIAVANKLTRDTITRNHPQVQKWIGTIRHAVLDCGINLLDTAPWYGHGVSEIVVGYALEDILKSDSDGGSDGDGDGSGDGNVDGGEEGAEEEVEVEENGVPSSSNKKKKRVARSDLIINTKVGRYESTPERMFDFSYDRIIDSVRTSLDRLRCGAYVDVVQLHDPEFSPSTQLLLDETIPALLEIKSRGWAKAIGITGYPLEVQRDILVRSAVRGGRSYDPPTFVFDQALTYCHANLHDMSLFIAPPPPSPLVFFEPPSTISLSSDADRTLIASNKTGGGGGGGGSSVGSGTSSGNGDSKRRGSASHIAGTDNLTGIGEEEEFVEEMSFAEFCGSRGIALMAAAPLSMGLLTQAGPPPWHPASDELKEACRNAAYICREEYGVDIASLAILFALAQGEIPCTLLGMKSVEEVDRAMELARRFEGLDLTLSTEEVLVTVVNEEEGEALATVLDDEYGPFAQIWQDGEFSWDGFEEAARHWDKVEGGREAAEARMRVRK